MSDNAFLGKRIVMIGTALDSHGGVSAVVNVLKAGGLFERHAIEYIATHRDSGMLGKVAAASAGWVRFAGRLILGRMSLLHVHMASRASFWRKLMFIVPAWAAGIPVVVHLHGGEFHRFYGSESGRVARRLIRLVFQKADRVVVLSHAWAEWARAQFPKAPVSVVYNPVLLPSYVPSTGREAGWLVSLGRVGAPKGTFDLIDALALLVRAYPRVRLLLGGDGALEEATARAAALGVSDHVEILGWVRGEEKQRLLCRAEIFVLPSYNEGLPMGVLEAMAAGLPIVSTPVGGVPDAVTDGVEGFLITPGDVTMLADRVKRLLADPELRRRMGEAARHKVESNFSVERIVPQIEAIYSELGIGARSTRQVGASMEREP